MLSNFFETILLCWLPAPHPQTGSLSGTSAWASSSSTAGLHLGGIVVQVIRLSAQQVVAVLVTKGTVFRLK